MGVGPSLQALGQNLVETDFVVYSFYAFKHNKSLGKGFHVTVITKL